MKKKSFKILLLITGIIVILLLVLPEILKRYTIKHSKELIGRQIQIDKLKYNYFTSTIKVYNFKMLEQNEVANFVSFDTLIINLEPLQLFKDKIEIEEFYLKSLDVNIIMKDSVFNFDDLIDFYATSEDSIPQNTEAPPFKFSISNIAIEESDFHFNNQDIEHITNLENLSFLVPFIGWDQEEKSNADVKFNFPRGGYFESKLNINPINGAYDATITISELYLDPFYKYVAEYAKINSFNGVLNSKIHIEGNTNEAVKSIVYGQVNVTDFAMTDTNNKTFLSAKKIAAAIQNVDSFNNSYIIDSLAITEPYSYFKIDSVTNNISEIFKLNDSTAISEVEIKTNATKDSIEEKPLFYSINYFEMKKGAVDLSEGIMGNPIDYHFSEFNLSIHGISSTSEKIEAAANLLVNKSTAITALTEINPMNDDFNSQLEIVSLNLNLFYPYTTDYLSINSLEGIANSNLVIKGNVNDYEKLIISGRVEIANFEMTDNQDKSFLKAKNIDCTIRDADAEFSSVNLKSLTFTEPYIYFEMDSITNNFFKIFNLNPAFDGVNDASDSSQKTAVTNEESMFYNIDIFKVKRGVMDYRDHLTGDPFNYHLSEIKIDAAKINSDAKWIDIKSEMLLNNRGNLVADIGYNPTDTNYAKLDFSIENFLLPDLNIYTNYYMGHNIIEGDMYYYSNSVITAGTIESENNLLVKNVSVNNTEKGIYALPLKFALFLLTDKNGDVNLDIPVSGDLNDPSLNVGKIVWSSFKNLIVKAASSPGKLLAGLVGGDPKDIEEIKFGYLDSIPSDKNYKQLDKLLELEQKKEGLKIELVYYVDEKLQKEAIAKEEVGKMYFNETQKDYLKDNTSFEAYVLNKTIADSLDFKNAYLSMANPKLVDSIANSNSELLISKIENYLSKSQSATKINILISDSKAPENTGSYPIFKVNFSLKEDENAATNN